MIYVQVEVSLVDIFTQDIFNHDVDDETGNWQRDGPVFMSLPISLFSHIAKKPWEASWHKAHYLNCLQTDKRRVDYM